jgi:hypothetical protein
MASTRALAVFTAQHDGEEVRIELPRTSNVYLSPLKSLAIIVDSPVCNASDPLQHSPSRPVSYTVKVSRRSNVIAGSIILSITCLYARPSQYGCRGPNATKPVSSLSRLLTVRASPLSATKNQPTSLGCSSKLSSSVI